MTQLTLEELRLVIDDTITGLPESLKGGEIASMLASIAASYSSADREAVMHLQTAILVILQPESAE